MSFIINPFLQYEVTPTLVSSGQVRNSAAGSTVSFSTSMTLNAFRLYVVHWENGSNVSTLTSASVNGFSPTIITQTHIQQGGTGCGIALLQLRYPLASATQTFTLNFNDNITAYGMGTYTIFRNSNDTPYTFQTATKDTSGSVGILGMSIPPKSLNVIAATNLVNGSISFAVRSTPPTITTNYNLAVPATSSQFQMGAANINNGSSTTDYPSELIDITTSTASACYATVTYI